MREGWEYKKLGEVCTIERGGSPRPITDYITDSEDGINWIKIGDAQEGSKYITSTKEKIRPEGIKKSRFVHKGDFILSNSMSFGKPYILKVDGCIHDGWLVIHDNNEVFIKDYLYYILASPIMYSKFSQLAVGGVVNNLNSSLVRKVTIPLPPKSTQLAIVSELDKINELIRLKKEQLKDFDNLAQSIFYEMFGDPVENERGWEVKTLGEMSTCITNGNTPKGGSLVYVDKGILFLRSQNVWKNRLDLEDVAYIDEATHQSMQRSSLHKNDLLITKTGRINTENSSLGRTALYIGEDNTANINGHVYLVRLKKDVPAKYILYILISKSYYELIRKTCVGGIDKRQLNLNHIENFPIPNPPLEQQEVFVRCVEAIEHQKAEVQKAIADLETLLASRMQYWFE
ncbi:hypothetical protein CIK97_11650 [Prevotella sp. P3-120]|uniref:restriction endonuclease subunit S n=1 Tax=unclassified Prevotella TaxID=2638335 RepID=UPI000B974F88|nr:MULTISPECIES: restriction endonuclease subunit S [unclassified Prevotella]OYP47853.1 hypothetical protein CIK97_11650 [Prevotella sp. P3-120]OYP53022.1 hypothetical protein CIK93_00960 [Prevotella sp. P3-92]